MKDKISIIVPIYNVEEYLEDCIKSLLNQTYKNLEILLVDDGSLDRCGQICDEWAKVDHRIRVIHKENGGLSDARNAGLTIASGAYIGFVDSDDVVHPQMYETLWTILHKTDSDISCCEATRELHRCMPDSDEMDYLVRRTEKFYGEDGIPKDASFRVLSSLEAIESLLRLETISVTVWNKLYKRETIGDMRFPKGKYHEDEFWTYLVLERANRIVYTDLEYYGYRERGESITTQRYTSRHLDHLDARSERLVYMEENYPQFSSLERTNLRFESIRAMQLCMMHMDGDELKNCRKRILDKVRNYPIRYKDYKRLPFGRKVWCLMSNLTFVGTCKIRNRFHYGP